MSLEATKGNIKTFWDRIYVEDKDPDLRLVRKVGTYRVYFCGEYGCWRIYPKNCVVDDFGDLVPVPK